MRGGVRVGTKKKQDGIFSHGTIDGLRLRNRVIRAGCFEGLSPDGVVTDRLIEHHRALAAGGVAMTTVAYCAVSFDGRAFDSELWMREEILPGLRRLTDAVHAEGAAASIQLVHCGFFADRRVIGRKPVGASRKLCVYRMSFCRSMTAGEIEEKTAEFARAASMAKETGFDAVEIHAGHGYLLSQFLSPWTNRRDDEYGGSLENRLRFPAAVVRRVREAVGKGAGTGTSSRGRDQGYPILVKMNQRDGMKRGLEIDEAVEVARRFEAEGASALVPSCGFTAKTPLSMMRGNVPVREMAENRKDVFGRLNLRLFGRLFVQRYPFAPMFLIEGARRIRDAVGIPVVYVGGVLSLDRMEAAVAEGFPFIQIGRATVRDPAIVSKLRSGEIRESDCDQCNRCIAAMEAGGVYCVSAERGLMKRDWERAS
jgi:2,4-dienoyl-CoA reductase-like NADH-dependent reductase (Old Yellow Enzyme family)